MAAEAGRRLASALLACTVAAGCAHSTYGDPAAPVAGAVLGTTVHTRDAEELRYIVLRQLSRRHVEERGIAVTQAERDAYVRMVREGLAKDRERSAARRAELAGKLAAGGLPEAERAGLMTEIASLDQTLAAPADLRSAPESPEDAEARQQVANALILQWKINQTLYRQYGGRIIFQQGGPEPLDAYRRLLEEAQSRGDFRIVNKDLEVPFWRYYRDDSIHSFYRAGSPEEAAAFRVAPWQSTAPGGGG
jgi:hypothetical protein